MSKNRLDINFGCERAFLGFFLGASVFVLIVGLVLLVTLGFLFYG